jgi:hypothetical protein
MTLKIEGTRVHINAEDLEKDSFSYGHAYPDAKGAYVLPQFLSGSDYSGGTVTRSNHDVWRERFNEYRGKLWWNLHGGHGTYAIAVPVDLDDLAENDRGAPEETVEAAREMIEVLEGLANYPLIDEDAHSELENENENEAWTDYGEREFAEALEAADPRFEQIASDPDNVGALWRALSETTNTYVTHEEGSGGGVHFDVDRVVAGISYNGEGLDPFFELVGDDTFDLSNDLNRYGNSLALSLLSDDYVARRLHDVLPRMDEGKNWPTGEAKDALVDIFWAMQPGDEWISASEVAKALKGGSKHDIDVLQDAYLEDPSTFEDRLEADLAPLLPKT